MSERRQHPIAILFSLVRNLKSSIFSLLPLLFIFIKNPGEWTSYIFKFIPLYFLFLLLTGFLSWWFTIYRLEGEELYFRRGVFVKKELFIKWARVQTISTRANLIHQFFSLEGLSIETAGGGASPEIYLQAITQEEAEKIIIALKKREDLLTQDQMTVGAQQAIPSENLSTVEEDRHFKLPTKDVFLAGLTSGEIGLLFAGIAFLYSQVEEFIPETWYTFFLERIEHISILLWLWIALGSLFLSWVISIFRFALKYAYFTVYRQGEEIRISRGLLERRQIVLKHKRIQGITIVEGLLRQPFGFAALEIEAIGGAGGAEQSFEKIILHPFIRKSEIKDFLASIVPEYTYSAKLIPLPRRAARRFMFRYMLLPLLVVSPLIYFQPLAIYALILPILAAGLGYAAYQASGYQVVGDQILMSTRRLAKFTGLVKRKHIQELGQRESFFQRRAHLQTAFLRIISSPAYRSYKVRDLDKKDAERILAWFDQR